MAWCAASVWCGAGEHQIEEVQKGFLKVFLLLLFFSPAIINHGVNSNSAKLICPGGRVENKNGVKLSVTKNIHNIVNSRSIFSEEKKQRRNNVKLMKS